MCLLICILIIVVLKDKKLLFLRGIKILSEVSKQFFFYKKYIHMCTGTTHIGRNHQIHYIL